MVQSVDDAVTPVGDRLRRAPWLTTLVAVLVVMVDGFNLLALSLAAPSLAEQWRLDVRILGILLGVASAGMGLGAVFLAPLADRFGRKAIILAGLTCVAAGMVIGALADSVATMVLARVVTGLGVGAITPVLNALAVESAPPRRRGLVVGVISAGLPLGTTIGGAVSIPVLALFGWRGVFATGATLSLLSLLLTAILLRESADYLAEVKLRPPQARAPSGPIARLRNLNGDQGFLVRTLLVCGMSLATQFSLYFVLQWIPAILHDAGLRPAEAVSVSVAMSLGGVVGALGFGAIVRPRTEHAVTATLMVAAFGLIVLFAHIHDLLALEVLGLVVGVALYAVAVGFYTIMIGAYPPRSRVSGVGLSVGIGRIGAVLGPVSAGFLIGMHWPRWGYFTLLSTPLLAAAVVALRVRERVRRDGHAGGDLRP